MSSLPTGCHGLPLRPPAVEVARRLPVDDLPMRLCTLVVMLCGVAALHQAQLLPASTAVLAGLGCAAGSGAAWKWPTGTGAAVRKGLSLALLLLAAGAALTTAMSASLDQLSSVLAGAIVGLAVAQSLVQVTRRDLGVGAVVGTVMMLLAAGIAPGTGLAGPLILGCGFLLAQVIVASRHLDIESAHLVSRPGDPFGRSTATQTARTAVTVALVAIFVLLLMPHPGGSSLRNRLARGSESAAPDQQPVTRADQSSLGLVDLRVRGPLSDAPVLQVPADSPSLWRDAVLDTYSDNTWSVSQEAAGPLGMLPDDGQVPIPPGEGPVADQPTTTYVARPLHGFTGAIAAPGRVTRVVTGGRVMIGFGALMSSPGRDAEYAVTVVRETDVHDVKRATGNSAPTDPAWTALPAGLPQRVIDLAHSLVAPGTDPARAVRTVEAFVRNRATYTLDSPVPPAGEDSVDDFLFNSRQGFCEHFASAEVVLLRAAGIPARFVTGYAGGTDNGDGSRTFVGTDAHAWVEAWVPGAGWVSSDPTAGATLAPASTSWWSTLHTRLDQLLSSVLGRVALAVGLAAAVALAWCLIVLVRRTSRRRRRTSVPPAGVDEPAPLPAFRRLEAALVTTGAPRAPAESLGQLSRRLPTSAADAAALTTVGSTCYAAESPDPAETQKASAQLDRFTTSLTDNPPS